LGEDNLKNDKLKIANQRFNSRLIVGTGKYKNMKECAKAIKLSGAEIVTVAVRRVNIIDKKKPLLMDYLNPKKIQYLPNTAGCFNSVDALRTLRLAREIGGWTLVKLEVLGDKLNLFPDMIETLKSTEVLTKEGFEVMVYCNDDPLMAKRLENAGAVAIMPLAAPIGSGLGIQNKINIQIIRKQTKLPLIIDAGLGQASDASIAMELGCDGVLVNTAIAKAKNPFEMALAFKNAVIAGRQSFNSGRIDKTLMGKASSPLKGII
jgi:thiazole synthase